MSLDQFISQEDLVKLNGPIRFRIKKKSAEVGERNAIIIVGVVMKWLEQRVLKIKEGTLVYSDLPKYHPLDKVIWRNSIKDDVVMQIEAKVRDRLYEATKISTNKEVRAKEDFSKFGIKSYYVSYCQDIRKMLIYNIFSEEPSGRTLREVGRPDDRPNDTDDYSFYKKYIEIR